jgi:hypothetical protein
VASSPSTGWPSTNCVCFRRFIVPQLLESIVDRVYDVMSQFKRTQAHVRNHGEVKWKHVMHLIRLLISGTTVLREGFVPVRVEEHRERSNQDR